MRPRASHRRFALGVALLSATLGAGACHRSASDGSAPSSAAASQPGASASAGAQREAMAPALGSTTPETIARAFVEALRAGAYARAVAMLDETMSKGLPEEKLRATWEGLRAQQGALTSIDAVKAETNGDLVAERLTCSFDKGPLELRVVVAGNTNKVTGFWIRPVEKTADYQPPAYVRLGTFTDVAVTIGSGEWQLPGTLCKPKGAGPLPALVLVSGSGPHDRDETIGPNLPFRDLGWGLGSRGVATLRFDKRTFAHQAKMAAHPDDVDIDQEYVEDACAAVALLAKTEGVDPKRIFVLGHSQGGQMVPRIAQRCPEVAGVIGLAASIRALEDVVIEQTEYILSLHGPIDAAGRAKLDELRAIAKRVKDPRLSPSTPARDIMGLPARYWLSLRAYDAGKAGAAIPQPMLMLQGGRDYQVTTTDFDLWKRALGRKKNVAFKLYPDLNHLFIEGTGKSKPAEYEQPGHAKAEVLDDIAAWIAKPGG
jgi:dienelactone hydrolase